MTRLTTHTPTPVRIEPLVPIVPIVPIVGSPSSPCAFRLHCVQPATIAES